MANITSEAKEAFGNVTDAVVDYASTYSDHVKNATKSFVTGNGTLDDITDFPPIDIDLNIEVPKIPESELTFQFDGLELYMELDTALSLGGTYVINMYTSKSPVGFTIGDSLLVGVVFTIDLMIDVKAEIDIKSGFQ